MSTRYYLLAHLTLAAAFLVAPFAGAQPLVWSDEFDGPTLDHSIWTYNVGGSGFGNGELQYHTARPENAYIDSGNLVIEARREHFLGGKEFTSARLVTHGRMAFKYGTLVARIKLPDVDNGMWPAFWLLGANIGQVPWPGSGELDIMEVGRRDGFLEGLVNRRVSSHAFWDFEGAQADYGAHLDWPTDLYNDYHLFEMEWTPAHIKTFLDGVNIWTIDISDAPTHSLEEFHAPMYIIANVAVGGWNFVEITDPAQITAPFPGRMYVDYMRLYDNGDTELYFAEDIAETENFGVFTETTPVNNQMVYESDAALYIWNNLTAGAPDAYEGAEGWHMTANAGAWFGMGAFSHIDRNMQNYSDGHLHFHMKTTSTAPFKVGIKSSAAGESWVNFVAGESDYGLVRDGAWHEVVIPLNSFLNIDYNTVHQLFMIAGDPPPTTFEFSIDNIYWSPSIPRPTPENGSFGIFTEDPTHKTAGEYVIGTDGEFYVWENSLQPIAEDPYEGAGSMAFTSTPGFGWFGAAFTPTTKYNLTAFRYPESVLHLAMKTASATPFYLGMRSGNVDDIGQKWIKFEPGSDPYGLVRDGAWHVLEIPMTDIADAVDLSQVSMLFEILGVDGAIANIEFDDVCLLNGGAAITDDPLLPGDLNCDGVVNFGDIDPFVLALTDATGYAAAYPACHHLNADINDDGVVNFGDIDPFVGLITGS